MRGFVLQDWVTIRGATSTAITQVIQNEGDWLSLETYQDAVFSVQVSEFSTSGTGTITLNLETAPIKDESLFVPMGAGTPAGISITQVYMTPPKQLPVILSAMGSGGNPLSRWVRWRLVLGSGFTSAWDISFRVLVTCNQMFGAGMQGSMGGFGAGWPQGMR